MVDGSKSGVVEVCEMAPDGAHERVRISGLGAVNEMLECGNGHGAPLYGHGAEAIVAERGIAVDRAVCAPVKCQ